MNCFFVDAESDGLYGRFLSVAALVTDGQGNELDCFYAAVTAKIEDIKTPWVRDNVYPYLKNATVSYRTEKELLAAFWSFWLKHRENSECISHVSYPVESRLFAACVVENENERSFLAPFPLYDLSTLLVARGYDFNVNMASLSGLQLDAHDAMNDVKMLAAVWRKLR